MLIVRLHDQLTQGVMTVRISTQHLTHSIRAAFEGTALVPAYAPRSDVRAFSLGNWEKQNDVDQG